MNLVDRARNMILSPKTEWQAVAAEAPDTNQIIVGYVVPLAALQAICIAIGWGLIGGPFIGRSLPYGIGTALVALITAVIGVFISAFVIDALAPNFASQKSLGRAVQLVAYSMTPAMVGGLLGIIPMLSWVGALFGLYGLYVLYLGFPWIMRTPQDKVVVYLIVSIVVILVVYVILSMLLSGIVLTMLGVGALTGLGRY